MTDIRNLIDDSEPGAWQRFFAQRDETPHTPLTDAELSERLAGAGQGVVAAHHEGAFT